MKIPKLPVYGFERLLDVRILWSFIGISALTFLIVILFSPLIWWLKIAILSLTTLFSLLFVLLFHEMFSMVRRIRESIMKK